MRRILLFSIVLLLSSTAVLHAGPALDDYLDIRQPDGTSFKARKHGDEFQNWTESESGHTVIRNRQSKEWEYAAQNLDGTLRGSGHRVNHNQKAPAHIPRKLKPPRDVGAERSHSQSLQEIYRQRITSSAPAQPSNYTSAASAYSAGDWTPKPLSGNRKIILLLVNFADRSLATSASGWNSAVFSSAAGDKSVANYFKDNSFNTFFVTPVPHNQPGSPAGVITVSVPHAHPDNGTAESVWVASAINAADPFVNFASLDTNGNGYIDRTEAVVYLIPAGYEESGSSKVPSVWAHAARYSGTGLYAAGKVFPGYAMNGELNDYGVQHPMGVIVHELGHQFCGLPDLYDISENNQGLGYFSLMAGGSWGMDIGEFSGATPTNLDAWSREYLGWATPVTPASAAAISLAHPLSSQGSVYKLVSPLVSSTEYFLVENRQPVGWDLGLRGKSAFGSRWAGGLLVTHIDVTSGTAGANNINDYAANNGRQGVIPVQASTSKCDMLSPGAYCRGHATTLFYSGNNAGWAPLTTPNSNTYSGAESGFSLLDISLQAPTMTAGLSISLIKAFATVTLGGLSATYDGTAKAATATTIPAGKTVTFTYNGNAAAPSNAGSYAVVGTISDSSYQGSASGILTIGKAAAAVTLGGLSATYDDTAKAATATTIPAGKTVTFTYNGNAAAPTSAGSYAVVGTISDSSYQGSASGILTIGKATATVNLDSLSATFDGTAKAATATTIPAGKTVTFTYNGNAAAPTSAGSYAIVGTISDSSYQGSASGTLVIARDAVAPTLIVSTLSNNATTANPILNVAGTVSDGDSGVKSLSVNGQTVRVENDGTFSAAIALNNGTNTITTIAADIADNRTIDIRTITLDLSAPVLTITLPSDNSVTSKTFADIAGSVDDQNAAVTARVNGGPAEYASMNGTSFNATLNLASGLNTIDITAADQAGNSTSSKRTITSDTVAPSLVVAVPAQDMTTTQGSITIGGTVSDAVTSAVIDITVNGQGYTPDVAADGSFSQTISLPVEKTYAVIVTATDQGNNSAVVQRNIIKTAALTQPTINDALKVFHAYAGLTRMTASEQIRYDVAPLSATGTPFGNGVIDAADVILILRRSIGIGSW